MSMNPTRATAFAVIKRLEASTQHVLGKGSAYWKSHETIHCRRCCIASFERSSQIPSLTTLSSSRKCIPIHVLFPHSNDAETKMVKYTVLSLQSSVAASVLSVSFVEDWKASLNASRSWNPSLISVFLPPTIHLMDICLAHDLTALTKHWRRFTLSWGICLLHAKSRARQERNIRDDGRGISCFVPKSVFVVSHNSFIKLLKSPSTVMAEAKGVSSWRNAMISRPCLRFSDCRGVSCGSSSDNK